MKNIRINQLIIISVLLLSMISAFSNKIYAEDTIYTEGSLKYVINENGNVKIVEYFGKETEVKIPMNMGKHIVTEIDSGVFTNKEIETIEIPNTISIINANSFKNIDDISIKCFDVNGEIVDNNFTIVYPVSNETNIDKNNEEEFTINEINDVEIIDNKNESDNKENEKPIDEKTNEAIIENDDNIESNDINSPTITKTKIEMNIGSYLLISAIVIFVLIIFVIIVKRRGKRHK